MATLNAATSIGVEQDFGSVTAGRIASLVVVDDLATFPIDLVVSRRQIGARRGEYLLSPAAAAYPDSARETVRINARLRAADFHLPVPDGAAAVRVIGVTPRSLVTEEVITDMMKIGRGSGRSRA